MGGGDGIEGATKRSPRKGPGFLRLTVVLAAVVLVVGGGGFALWRWYVDAGLPTTTPRCAWPLVVRGPATGSQAGLLRCYVRAMARDDLPALRALVDSDPPVRVSKAQLVHAADAKSGVAVATFTANPVSTADATVKVTYRDGAADTFHIGMVNPQADAWRIEVGSYPADPGLPPAVSAPATP